MEAPFGKHSLFTAPTNSVEFIKKKLQEFDSPMLEEEGAVEGAYYIMKRLGINPSYGFAFFIHESTAGTIGVATTTKNFGNLRHGSRSYYEREIERLRQDHRLAGVLRSLPFDIYYNRGNENDDFRDYSSWLTAAEDFATLLLMYLKTRNVGYTVEDVIPEYAPSNENDVKAYIDSLVGRVEEWKHEEHGQTP